LKLHGSMEMHNGNYKEEMHNQMHMQFSL
jgi:hypothetical protein